MQAKNPVMFIFRFFALCFIALTGCTADTSATRKTILLTRPVFASIADVPTPDIFPSFILEVSPMPSTTIPFDLFIKSANPGKSFFMGWENNESLGYDASVCVRYNLTPLLIGASDRFIKYRTMLIDGKTAVPLGGASTEMLCQHVTEDGTTTPWDCNEHAVCWESPFQIGLHKATFQVHFRTSGEVQEYTWYYEIVEPMATPTP